jgi:VanZ like family
MTFQGFQSIFPGYPGFVPGALITIVIGFIANGLVSKALYISRGLALGIIICLGLILSATLTVGGDDLNHGANSMMSCDFTRLEPAPLAELLTVNETSLNIFLFVPFGMVIGLIPRSPRRASILAAVFALPFGLETIQLLMPAMNRTCQSADVIDNLFGLLAGLVSGMVTRLLKGNNSEVGSSGSSCPFNEGR